jgi:hypothetical protein
MPWCLGVQNIKDKSSKLSTLAESIWILPDAHAQGGIMTRLIANLGFILAALAVWISAPLSASAVTVETTESARESILDRQVHLEKELILDPPRPFRWCDRLNSLRKQQSGTSNIPSHQTRRDRDSYSASRTSCTPHASSVRSPDDAWMPWVGYLNVWVSCFPMFRCLGVLNSGSFPPGPGLSVWTTA